jgi:hypothetical protein
MSQLATFFHGQDTKLGVFYPTHYLIAIFPSLEQALAAERKLRGMGFSGEQVMAAPGQDLNDLVREETAQGGVSGYLMKEFSRFLHTEAAYTDIDLKHAGRGAAVLAVRCDDEQSKQSAWDAIASDKILAARYYATGGIEHLAGET